MADIFNLSDTWDSGTTVYNGIKMDVTNTASHADSLVMDLLVDATSSFCVSRDGRVGIKTDSPLSELHATHTGTPVITLERVDTSIGDGHHISYVNTRGGEVTITEVGQIIVSADQTWTATASGTYMAFLTMEKDSVSSLTERFRIDEKGNCLIGTSAIDGTAAGVLAIANGTAPGAGTANQSYIYAKDVGSSSEMHVMDEAGNETPISPHMDEDTLLREYGIEPNADDPMPRIEMTRNAFIGCEQLTYTDPITHVSTTAHRWLEDEEMVDWDETQDAHKQARDRQIEQWQVRKDNREAAIADYHSHDEARKAELIEPEAFTEQKPKSYVPKSEPSYVTRGKLIRNRMK